MEICIKNTLKKLRQQKNITQEQLADHLGITYQSVGKWERGEGFPDITLIPTIALYFGITSDELLGIDKKRIDQKITDYQKQSAELRNKGQTVENLELWQKAFKIFPEEYRVQKEYIDALYAVCALKPIIVIEGEMQPWDDELQEKGSEILSIGEHLLLTCTDRKITDSVTDILCHTAHHMGNLPLARKYAEKLGSYYCTQESHLEWLLDKNDAISQAQENVLAYLTLMTYSLRAIGARNQGTSDERIAISQLIIDIWERALGEDDGSFYQSVLAEEYYLLATEFAVHKKTGECLSALEQMTCHAIRFDKRKDGTYCVPWFKGKPYMPEASIKNYRSNDIYKFLKYLNTYSVFDALRNHPRFIEITNRLRQAAKEKE